MASTTTGPVRQMTVRAAGLYRIRVRRPGRVPLVYIGRAINLRERERNHWSDLAAGKHHNRTLQAAYNRYGAAAMTFEVIELTTWATIRDGRLIAVEFSEAEQAALETERIRAAWEAADAECANFGDGYAGGATAPRNAGGWRKRDLPKGVYFNKAAPAGRPYKAQIRLKSGSNRHLGNFASPVEAASAYDLAVDLYLGGEAFKNRLGA